MKKQFTILFLISILNIIDAQPQKGSFFIGAKVGVFNIIQKKDKEENIGYFILPSLGYMITNKIGLSLDFKYYKNDYTIYYPTNPPTSSDFPISYKTENYNTNYQIGISTHFYIPINKKTFFVILPTVFFKQNVGYSSIYTWHFDQWTNSNILSRQKTNTSTDNILNFGVSPSLLYFINPKISLSFELNNFVNFGYSFLSNYSNNAGLTIALFSPTLGFNFWIHPKN